MLLGCLPLVLLACSERDPFFVDSAAATATAEDLSRWNEAYGWGDHADAGYLRSESDPTFSASPAATIDSAALGRFEAAYAWGDHAQAGYLTSEADPAFAASPAAGVTSTQIASWDQAVSWGDHAQAGYLTTETDPSFAASTAATISAGDVSRWNQAYGWGDHTTFGYAVAADLGWVQAGATRIEARVGGAPVIAPDQSATGTQNLMAGYTTIWQSFTAGTTGELVRFTWGTYQRSNGNTFTLRDGEGTSGTVLYTTPVTITGQLEVPLPNIPVVAGQKYTAVLTGPNYTIYSIRFLSSGAYAGGTGGTTNGPATWDYEFTTYVASKVVLTQDSRLGIGVANPVTGLDVRGDGLRIERPRSPASTSACTPGEFAWDASYVYVCTATNQWKRATLATY